MQDDSQTLAVDPLVQRNRFVAFSFAATDLVLEIDHSDCITFESGACAELTGRGVGELIGAHWLELFIEHDRVMLERLLARLQGAGRVGRVAVRLERRASSPIAWYRARSVREDAPAWSHDSVATWPGPHGVE